MGLRVGFGDTRHNFEDTYNEQNQELFSEYGLANKDVGVLQNIIEIKSDEIALRVRTRSGVKELLYKGVPQIPYNNKWLQPGGFIRAYSVSKTGAGLSPLPAGRVISMTVRQVIPHNDSVHFLDSDDISTAFNAFRPYVGRVTSGLSETELENIALEKGIFKEVVGTVNGKQQTIIARGWKNPGFDLGFTMLPVSNGATSQVYAMTHAHHFVEKGKSLRGLILGDAPEVRDLACDHRFLYGLPLLVQAHIDGRTEHSGVYNTLLSKLDRMVSASRNAA